MGRLPTVPGIMAQAEIQIVPDLFALIPAPFQHLIWPSEKFPWTAVKSDILDQIKKEAGE